jgi:flagellar protein FlgJ
MADPVKWEDHTARSHIVAGQRTKNVPGRQADQNCRLEEACRNFESVFVQYMLKEMRQTVPQNGLIGSGHAEQMYTGMLDSELAQVISMQRGIGLASVLYGQLAAGSADIQKGSDKK